MDLLRTTAKGIAWTTVSTVVRSVVSLLQVAILTRFLPKSDFGIVAIANLFLGFTQIFMDLGISAGILHRNDTTRGQYSSLFWLNVMTGTLLTAVLCLLAPLVASIYGEPQLAAILALMSLSVFFSSLGSQHRTVQQKNMRFKYIALVEIASSLLSLALAAILAVKGAGIYSLVLANLFHAASMGIMFLVIGLVKDKNITFHFSLSETRDYLKIGVYSIGSQVLDYFSRELDILIISATLGKDTVGLYSLCKKLVLSVYGAVTPIVSRVITPVLALIQEQKERVHRLYLDITQTLALVNMPVYCLSAVFSLGILNFLYGSQYVDGAPLLIFLALNYGVSSTGNPVGSLQIAMGRTDLGLYWTICRIVLTAAALFAGSFFGINAIALAVLAVSVLSNPLFWRVTISPMTGGRYGEYFSNSLLVCLAVTVFSLPFWLLFGKLTSVWICLLIGVLYAAVYVLLVLLVFPRSYVVRKALDTWHKDR